MLIKVMLDTVFYFVEYCVKTCIKIFYFVEYYSRVFCLFLLRAAVMIIDFKEYSKKIKSGSKIIDSKLNPIAFSKDLFDIVSSLHEIEKGIVMADTAMMMVALSRNVLSIDARKRLIEVISKHMFDEEPRDDD